MNMSPVVDRRIYFILTVIFIIVLLFIVYHLFDVEKDITAVIFVKNCKQIFLFTLVRIVINFHRLELSVCENFHVLCVGFSLHRLQLFGNDGVLDPLVIEFDNEFPEASSLAVK